MKVGHKHSLGAKEKMSKSKIERDLLKKGFKMLEREIQLKLRDYCKNKYGKKIYWHDIKDLPTKRQHQKPFDVIGSFNGNAFAIEFKMIGGVKKDHQKKNILAMKESGAIADFVYLSKTDMSVNYAIMDIFFLSFTVECE